MEGILPVYKNVGVTSYDVVRTCKRKLREMGISKFKIGHGGTLDPFAEGVLLILIGRSNTKRMNELSALPKTYVAETFLGANSDTLDCTGNLSASPLTMSRSEIEHKTSSIKKNFVGLISQQIPNYSAAKVDGVPRYKLARKNEALPTKFKPVTINMLDIEVVSEDKARITTTVSSGTYIRQLSFDIFKSIGIDSYLSKLVRTKIGEYEVKDCIGFDDLLTKDWQSFLR